MPTATLRYLCSCLVAGLLILSAPLAAAPDDWTRLGPDRPALAGLAVDPVDNDIIYVAVQGGIFKSTDRALSWKFISMEGTFGNLNRLQSIRIDASDTNRLFARSLQALLTSTDAGETWSSTFPPAGIDYLDIDRVDASRMYIADGGFREVDKVYLSTNDGQNWTSVSNGLPTDQTLRAFAMDPTNSLHLYAGVSVDDISDTSLKTVFYSTDGGANWSPAATPPIFDRSPGPGQFVITPTILTPSPVNGNLVYAASGRYLMRSNDGGLNWVPLQEFSGFSVNQLLFDPADSTRLIAVLTGNGNERFLYQSSTADDTVWTDITDGYQPFLLQIAQSDGELVATSLNGFYISPDGGANWAIASDGIDRAYVEELLVHPTVAGRLFISGTRVGLLRSDDGGQTWQLLANRGPNILLFDPTDPSRLYGLPDRGVERSDDRGKTWTALPGVSDLNPTTSMAISALNSDELFFVTRWRLTRSTDGGASVEPMLADEEGFEWVVFDPVAPDTVYAVLDNNDTDRLEIYRSTSGGDDWVGLTDLPAPISSDVNPPAGSTVFDFVINPLNNQEMYLLGNGGLQKSVNGGVDWEVIATDFGISDFELDPLNPQRLFHTTFFGGLKVSIDGGANWEDFPQTSEIPQPSAQRIRISPHEANRIYVASLNGVLVTGPDFVPIDYLGQTRKALKSLKSIEKKNAVRNDNKSKKAARKARKHLDNAVKDFKAIDIDAGRSEIARAIKDLKKVRKEKSRVKKVRKRLEAMLK